jgi:hypothetical protein
MCREPRDSGEIKWRVLISSGIGMSRCLDCLRRALKMGIEQAMIETAVSAAESNANCTAELVEPLPMIAVSAGILVNDMMPALDPNVVSRLFF